MFFTYIWQSSGFTLQEANGRFSSVLLKQCELYEKAFGQAPGMKTIQIGGILVGQVCYDPGITGWRPWVDEGDAGIAWGGVCENYLGKRLARQEINEIRKTLDNDPGKLLSWDGMFYAAIWDGEEKKVALATAATECPTLWNTDGPYGWAAGPRAAPLLELVGRKAEPDMEALNLFLRFGYLIGGRSPFRHVRRVRDRQQATIRQNGVPVFKTYASLRQYLGPGWKNSDWKETVKFAADRLVQRVTDQMRHSPKPVVLLTGGRDSRSIVAAAKKTGYDFTTATGGPAGSEDAVIAARVSGILNIKHSLTGDTASPDIVRKSIGRIRTWTKITEGIIPIDFSLHMKDFLMSRLPFPVERAQYFHGLEPGIGRGSFYPHYPDVDAGRMSAMTLNDVHTFVTNAYRNRYLRPGPAADSLLQEVHLRLDSELQEAGGEIHQWFELFLWRQRGLVWGMDLQSVNTPVRWAWLPLFDMELMGLSWNLTINQKIEARLLLDASAAMEAALAEMPCTLYIGGRKTGLAGRIKNRILTGARRYSQKIGIPGPAAGQNQAAKDFSALWEAGLLSNGEHIWTEFIDRKNLLKIIGISPQNALLWRLMTVDFLARELF
ncbi:MAG: asparagine synthase-related protein [Nitrospiraceae bacterium]|nr:asparagine synthase-related protein [Nitrospiraceae bacterium]